MVVKTDKELEKGLEEFLILIGKLINSFFKSLYWGIRKLNKRSSIIGFLISFLVPIVATHYHDKIFSLEAPIYIQYAINYLLLFAPAIYLLMLGGSQDRSQIKYQKIFKEIGFFGPDKSVPFFIGMKKNGKKVIYFFKSNIPLQNWKDAIPRLENGLDCNILMIEEGKSKKIAVLTTVPSSFRIPNNIAWSDDYIDSNDGVVVLGVGAIEKIKFDLNKQPHILAAGETGSGKSNLLRSCLWQMVKKGCQVYMIDFKGGIEFGKRWEKFGEVITDRERALEVLKQITEENTRRMGIFRELEAKNLKEYNKKTGENLKRICVFCDEIGEMLDKKGASKFDKVLFEQIEGTLSSLGRLSRATGINLFLGVQRPDAKVLTGQIKSNITVRISGRFADKVTSEIVLGNTMAYNLPDIKGRFLIRIGNETTQFQAYFFDDDIVFNDTTGSQPSAKKESRVNKFLQKNKTDNASVATSQQKTVDKSKVSPKAKKSNEKKEKIEDSCPDQSPIDFDEKILWAPDLVNLMDKKENEVDLDFDYTKKE